MSVEAERETSVEYLVVTFDVPADEPLTVFAESLAHLNSLYSYCGFIGIWRGLRASHWIDPKITEIHLVKMRYGSPWQLVLTSVGQHAPYAAGIGAVFVASLHAFERVLRLKMEWDNHSDSRRRTAFELENDKAHASIEIIRRLNEALDYDPHLIESSARPSTIKAANDVASLPRITGVDIVGEDDPRV